MSFRLRITLMTITIIAVLFSAGGAVMIHTTYQSSLNKEEQAAIDSSQMVLKILQMVEEDKEWFDEDDLVTTITDISMQDTMDAICLTANKEIIYQRGSASSSFLNQTDNSSEDKILVSYFKTEKSEPYLQTTATIILGEKYYYLDIGRSLQHIYEVRERQIEAFRWIFLLLLIIGTVLSWLMASFLTEPIRKLQKASMEIASGNLSYRSNIHTGDEIEALSKDFDTMAEKMETNINQLYEAAEQKDRFMGAFTHELKTPMTSIIGYADLLRTQKLTDAETEDAINYIFSEAKRLENMSLKMLDIFVADKMELIMEEIHPKELTKYVADHLKNAYAKANIAIEIHGEEGTCMADRDFLQALLINLFDNARKSMTEGGVIEAQIKMLPDGCCISIKDQGKGIPKEAVTHLTEAFFRVDKARAREEGSAGLGLALCDKIVKLHHGRIEFDSKPGEGTTVAVYLKGGRCQ